MGTNLVKKVVMVVLVEVTWLIEEAKDYDELIL
jgi:hypothetical protein